MPRNSLGFAYAGGVKTIPDTYLAAADATPDTPSSSATWNLLAMLTAAALVYLILHARGNA